MIVIDHVYDLRKLLDRTKLELYGGGKGLINEWASEKYSMHPIVVWILIQEDHVHCPLGQTKRAHSRVFIKNENASN